MRGLCTRATMTRIKIQRYFFLRTTIMPRSTLVLLTATLVISVLSLFAGGGRHDAGGAPCGRRRARRPLSRLTPAEAPCGPLHGRGDEHCGPHHAAALREQVRLTHDGRNDPVGTARHSARAPLHARLDDLGQRALFAFAAAMAGTWLVRVRSCCACRRRTSCSSRSSASCSATSIMRRRRAFSPTAST